jgi:hypothetical protein
VKDTRSDGRRLELIGLDVADRMPRLRPRFAVPLLIIVLVGALMVAALRIDLIRMRYALAGAMAAEQRIVNEQRALTLRVRQLRDPVRLTARARKLGFVAPVKVIDLPGPGAEASATLLAASRPDADALGEARP